MKAKAKARTQFICKNCGVASAQWMGRCASCGEWNTLVEEKAPQEAAVSRRHITSFTSEVSALGPAAKAEGARYSTGIGELDRVLGGGLWPGSLVLLGGAPGIGKSTLILQAAVGLAAADRSVLYVSGEESLDQVKGRAQRLSLASDHLLLLSETNLENILQTVEARSPRILILDSIQTVYKDEIPGGAGSVSQVRECAAELLRLAKGQNISVFILGHLTKEGDLAGPRLLEHMVDTVLYFESERQALHRILRATKNRFGATGEIGVFEMTDHGLQEVANPSSLFLGDDSGAATPGTAVTAALEGTRPLLVEIQALVSRTLFGMPRRQTSGIDYNRALLLIAVLDKRCRIPLESQDVFVNVVGGLQIREPSADLALAVAIASGYLERSLPAKTLFIGEVGLGGELRPTGFTRERVAEAKKLGFERAVIPQSAAAQLHGPAGIQITTAATLAEALETFSLLPHQRAVPATSTSLSGRQVNPHA